jgi:hypothetical protein
VTLALILAALVAVGCAAACTTRLYFATSATTLHPAVWLAHLRRGEGEAVARAAERTPGAIWERDLLAALAEPDEGARAGRINEQLGELDFRLARWERVPRVCASIASSSGFLFGSLVLRYGLVAAGNAPAEARRGAIDAVVLQAVNVAVLGMAGAAFAIAAQYRARKAAQAFQRDADALVEALERKAAER